ncbi:MAG: hypothetical protein V4617_08985 [Gemmatimonadota bacterium]
MWADSLLALERGHLLRLALWGGASVLIGTLLLVWIAVRRAEVPLLRHFAIQTAAWGAIDLLICLWAGRDVAMRDFAGAQRLLNVLWLNTGLDAGYIAVGATIALTAWRWGKSPGGIGAGLGIIVQGLALLLLDIRLIAAIGPMQ